MDKSFSIQKLLSLCCSGRFNSDNKTDIIGLHMGSYNPWKGTNGLHSYIQKSDGTYLDGTDVIEEKKVYGGTGSILIA